MAGLDLDSLKPMVDITEIAPTMYEQTHLRKTAVPCITANLEHLTCAITRSHTCNREIRPPVSTPSNHPMRQ